MRSAPDVPRPPARTVLSGRQWAWLIRVALAAMICFALFHAIGWSGFRDALAVARWQWMVPVYLGAAAAVLINAVLLRFLLHVLTLQVGLRRILLAKSLGSFYSLILPGDMFAGVAKWANLSAATGDKARVLTAMIACKVATALPPLFIGSLALLADNPLQEPRLAMAVNGVAIALIVISLALLAAARSRRLAELYRAATGSLPSALARPAAALLAAFADLRHLRSRDIAKVLVLALALFGLGVLGMWMACKAASVVVPLHAYYWVSLLLFLSWLLPLTIGNLGVREGILVAAFGLYGVEPASAVLVGLLMFSSILFVGAFGGCYQLALAQRWIVARAATPRH